MPTNTTAIIDSHVNNVRVVAVLVFTTMAMVVNKPIITVRTKLEMLIKTIVGVFACAL